MNLPIISSTFFLTLLMMIGLIFFIRASVKDRTKQIKLIPDESADLLIKMLQDYFEQRAYKITAVDPEAKLVTFKGFVQPSLFLAILLTCLAIVGLSCFVMILFLLFPKIKAVFWLLLLLAPLAGVFYWKKAGRLEQILLQVISQPNKPNLVSIIAHRDELIQLQENLSVQAIDY